MKTVLLALFTLTTLYLPAQTDSLPSGVYSWSNAKVQNTPGGERRDVVKGSTLDLTSLQVHTSVLASGAANHAPVIYNDREEIVIVKDGNLQVVLNDSVKVLGPASLVLIEAGDEQSFQNTSSAPATYYVLTFRSKNGVDLQRGKSAGGSLLIDWNDLKVTKTDKGESRPIFVRPSSMFTKFDVHATALNPGFASHLPHTHRAEEMIVMIKGSGEMQIAEKSHKAAAGDIIFLEANVPHAFTNTGPVQCGYFAIRWNN
jgi:(S)-ureidoglycine aminohydrolase